MQRSLSCAKDRMFEKVDLQLLSISFSLAQNSEIPAKPTITLSSRVRHMIYWRRIKYWPAVLHDVRRSSFLVLRSSERTTSGPWAKGHPAASANQWEVKIKGKFRNTVIKLWCSNCKGQIWLPSQSFIFLVFVLRHQKQKNKKLFWHSGTGYALLLFTF